MSHNLSDKMLKDEVVQYISKRYNVTAEYLITHFSDIDLEKNELQIICDLIQMYK